MTGDHKFDDSSQGLKLPSKADFIPYGSLDEKAAYKHFHGLNLNEAYEKFLGHPEYYQEDFMFMGAKAFAYYYPILFKYLMTTRPTDECDDCEAWIIGCGLRSQYQELLRRNCAEFIPSIASKIRAFEEHLKAWPLDQKTMKSCSEIWTEVAALYSSIRLDR